MGDGELLRLLFEREDRSKNDRLWLLDTVAEFRLRDLWRCPATTIEHARRDLARCTEKSRSTRGPGYDSDVDRVAGGPSGNPRLGEDPALLEFTVGLAEQLSADEAINVIVRWPGHHSAEPLLWALLGRALHLPEPHRNSWTRSPTEPRRWRSAIPGQRHPTCPW